MTFKAAAITGSVRSWRRSSEAPAAKPIFAMKANVLTVDVARADALSEEQRAALTALTRTLFPPTTH